MAPGKVITILSDVKYIWLNGIVNHIPSWTIRRTLYLASGMKIGKHSRIGIGTIVVRPKGITIGSGCIINEYCHLDGRGYLIIGDNTSISIYTRIISASHKMDDENFEYISSPIIIEDHVFIGACAVILENSYLETGVVIGAGSVAKGTFENNSVYIGNPIRKIKERNCSNSYTLYHEAYFR